MEEKPFVRDPARFKFCWKCGASIALEANPCPKCSVEQMQGQASKAARAAATWDQWLIRVAGVFLVLAVMARFAPPPHAASIQGSPPIAAPEVITVDPDVLIGDYEANEVAADLHYKGKQLRISGAVGSIGKDILGSAYVAFGVPGHFRNVQAMLSSDESARAASISKGNYVTVVGDCSGMMGNVLIRNARFE